MPGPLLEGRIAAALEAGLRLAGVPQQQMKAGHLRLHPHIVQLLQALQRGFDALGFALGKTGGGQGVSAEEFSGDGASVGPGLEQINLFLDGEEAADLLEEGLKRLLREVRIEIPIQAAAALDQVLQELLAGLPVAAVVEIPAEQIENPKRQQGLQFSLQGHPLLLLLSHALQQLNALLQGLGGGFKAAVAATFIGGLTGGQGRQQAQVQFPAASQGRCLGRLQGATGSFKGFGSLARLHQQH